MPQIEEKIRENYDLSDAEYFMQITAANDDLRESLYISFDPEIDEEIRALHWKHYNVMIEYIKELVSMRDVLREEYMDEFDKVYSNAF